MDRKDVEVMTCCCKGNEDGNVKHKQRDEQEKKALMTRLSRIEGQVRGIRAMVEDDRYCVDILTQVSAIQAALNGFNKELLARHIKTCVSENIREGRSFRRRIFSHGIHRIHRFFFSASRFCVFREFCGKIVLWLRGYGIPAIPTQPSEFLPQNPLQVCLRKSSHGIHRNFWRRIFSHGFHRIHRSFWRRRASHRFHRCTQIFLLRQSFLCVP